MKVQYVVELRERKLRTELVPRADVHLATKVETRADGTVRHGGKGRVAEISSSCRLLRRGLPREAFAIFPCSYFRWTKTVALALELYCALSVYFIYNTRL